MTTLDVNALRESFDLVAQRAPDLTHRFYEILFERHPEVRPLFGRSMAQQEQMLTRALVAIIEHLESPTWLDESLRALGAKHVDYGVTEEMYPWVGEALLATLAEIADEAWTPQIERAWTDAYTAIAGGMIEGARQAQGPSPSPAAISQHPRSRPAA
jgi:hemoglobin-like flavoprotein